MVIVAEMVKHLIVVQAIVGSSPTLHTKYCGMRRKWLSHRSHKPRFRVRVPVPQLMSFFIYIKKDADAKEEKRETVQFHL